MPTSEKQHEHTLLLTILSTLVANPTALQQVQQFLSSIDFQPSANATPPIEALLQMLQSHSNQSEDSSMGISGSGTHTSSPELLGVSSTTAPIAISALGSIKTSLSNLILSLSSSPGIPWLINQITSYFTTSTTVAEIHEDDTLSETETILSLAQHTDVSCCRVWPFINTPEKPNQPNEQTNKNFLFGQTESPLNPNEEMYRYHAMRRSDPDVVKPGEIEPNESEEDCDDDTMVIPPAAPNIATIRPPLPPPQPIRRVLDFSSNDNEGEAFLCAPPPLLLENAEESAFLCPPAPLIEEDLAALPETAPNHIDSQDISEWLDSIETGTFFLMNDTYIYWEYLAGNGLITVMENTDGSYFFQINPTHVELIVGPFDIDGNSIPNYIQNSQETTESSTDNGLITTQEAKALLRRCDGLPTLSDTSFPPPYEFDAPPLLPTEWESSTVISDFTDEESTESEPEDPEPNAKRPRIDTSGDQAASLEHL